MPRMTQAEYRAWLARTADLRTDILGATCCDNESTLQREIRQWCAARNIPCGCARMDKPSTMPVGWPDMTIVLNGRVLFIECKTRTGKRTADQQIMSKLFEMQGQTIHIVRSFEEFVQLTKNQTNP